jgi:hypothetical protein
VDTAEGSACGGGVMSRDVDIAVSPAEMLDMIEEQLAWLAIMSESVSGDYFIEDLGFASPIVSLGDRAAGTLMPGKLVAVEWTDEERVRNGPSMRSSAMAVLPKLGARPRSAAFSLDGGTWSLRSTSLVPKKEAATWSSGAARGLPMVRYQNLQVNTSAGDSNSLYCMMALAPNGKCLHRDGTPMPSRSDGTNAMAESFFSDVLFEYNRRSSWLVEFSLSSRRTGVALETDASGARSLISDIGRSSSRRSNMVHWVSEHYRKSRGEDADPSFVRAHLRGANKVQLACGMFATIAPSRQAIELACNGKRFDARTEP